MCVFFSSQIEISAAICMYMKYMNWFIVQSAMKWTTQCMDSVSCHNLVHGLLTKDRLFLNKQEVHLLSNDVSVLQYAVVS